MGSRQYTDRNAYVLPERTVPDYNLIYLEEGAAEWVLEAHATRLESGDLILVPPGVRHHGRSLSPVMRLGSVHVMAELPGGLDLFTVFACPRLRRVAAGSRLDRLWRMAMEEYERPWLVAATMIPAWTSLIIKELIRSDAEAGRLRTTGADPLVDRILQYLETHLGQDLTLTDIAHHAGYTPQHLNRRFRQAVGATPLACLAGLRLERAAQLLNEGRLAVQAVAEAVGIGDPAYFARIFRARHHMSPSEFRHRAGSENPS